MKTPTNSIKPLLIMLFLTKYIQKSVHLDVFLPFQELKILLPKMKILAQGAEAIVYEDGDIIIKERISKNYRIPEIDSKLIKTRTKREAKILQKLYENRLHAPKLFKTEENRIYMEKIDGITVKQAINDENASDLMKKVGEIVAKLHNLDIVHGDLTTMNFLIKNNEIYVIDFGLSFFSSKEEDKAVDLYVFERALKCGHKEEYSDAFYQGYMSIGSNNVLKRLENVRLRGRKREETM